MAEKYYVIIKADYGYSIDEVHTEEEAKEFIQHPSKYEWIKIIKGRLMEIDINPILTVEEEKPQ